MHRPKIWAVVNLLGFTATIAINAMANALPINGVTTGEVSDMYSTLFTPAGFTFAIWSVIYLALLVFVIYQVADAWRQDGKFVRQIGPYFLLASVANSVWIFVWHHQVIWLSIVIMLLLLFSLLQIYQRLNIGNTTVSPGAKWCVHIPFQIYLGWITIATIANGAIVLVYLGWDALGVDPRFWTLFMLWVGVTIAFRLLSRRNDYAFTLVVCWAFFGIAMKRMAEGQTWTDLITAGSLVGIALLILAIGHRIYLQTRGNR